MFRLFKSQNRGRQRVLLSRVALLYVVFLGGVMGSMLMGSMLMGCRSDEVVTPTGGGVQVVSHDGLELETTTSVMELPTSGSLDWRITIRYPMGYRVELPEVGEEGERWGAFYIENSQVTPDRLDTEGLVKKTKTYTLEPDAPGEFEIPGIHLSGRNQHGEPVEVTSKPMKVTVTSVLTSGQKSLRDIAPDVRPAKVTGAGASRWPMLVVLFNVLVVIVLVLVWRRWKRQGAGPRLGQGKESGK